MMRTIAVLLFVLVLSVGAFPAPVLAQTNEQRETFAKAYALYANGKSAEAKELFEKTLDDKFRLADYSLYYLAVIAFNGVELGSSAPAFDPTQTDAFRRVFGSSRQHLLQAKIDYSRKKICPGRRDTAAAPR